MNTPKIQDIIFGYVDRDIAHSESKQNLEFDSFEKRLLLHLLFQHVIRGEYNEVSYLLSTLVNYFPDLLKQKSTVCDHNGYVYGGLTLLQLALTLRDVDIIVFKRRDQEVKVVEGLAELIFGKIKVHYGEKEVVRQYEELFQKKDFSMYLNAFSVEFYDIYSETVRDSNGGVGAPACEKKLEAFKGELPECYLNLKEFFLNMMESFKVFDAIRISSSIKGCELAIEQFKNYFKSKNNPAYLEETVICLIRFLGLNNEIFRKNNSEIFDEAPVSKSMFSYFRVIGFLQSLMPACSLQVSEQKILRIMRATRELDRSHEAFYQQENVFTQMGQTYCFGKKGLLQNSKRPFDYSLLRSRNWFLYTYGKQVGVQLFLCNNLKETALLRVPIIVYEEVKRYLTCFANPSTAAGVFMFAQLVEQLKRGDLAALWGPIRKNLMSCSGYAGVEPFDGSPVNLQQNLGLFQRKIKESRGYEQYCSQILYQSRRFL